MRVFLCRSIKMISIWMIPSSLFVTKQTFWVNNLHVHILRCPCWLLNWVLLGQHCRRCVISRLPHTLVHCAYPVSRTGSACTVHGRLWFYRWAYWLPTFLATNSLISHNLNGFQQPLPICHCSTEDDSHAIHPYDWLQLKLKFTLLSECSWDLWFQTYSPRWMKLYET